MTSIYTQLWRKKMANEGTLAKSILNHSKRIYSSNFADDPSYKKGILLKRDLTKVDIDTRIINVDRTTKEKRIQILPDNVIDIGDYIVYPKKSYVVTEFEDNYVVPYSKALECIQTINLQSWENPMPCWGDNTSYGVKGEVVTNFFSVTDGKFQFKVQCNKWTDMLDKDIRIMFNHKYVYRIVEIENILSYGGIYVVTVKRDETQNVKDDFKNNIAYNEEFDKKDPVNPNPDPIYAYNIIADNGDLSIKKYNMNTFRVIDKYGNNISSDWDIGINYNGLDEKYMVVKEKGNNYIKLLNSKGYYDKPIILTFKYKANLLTTEVKLVN